MTLAIRSRFLFSLSNGQFRSPGIWPSSLFQIVRVLGFSRLVCFTFSSGWVVSHIIGMFSRSAAHCLIESGHSLFPWSLVFFFVFAFPRSGLLIRLFGGQYFVRLYSRFQSTGGLHALLVMLILRPNHALQLRDYPNICVGAAFVSPAPADAVRCSSKLEIHKRDRPACGEQFQRQKCENVCRDLNTRGLQRQSVNELVALLRDGEKQRNEDEDDRAGC